ncbi:MAG: RNA polymerase factor sigma-54 [Myxococcota bacterium]|nr:RNA polymerase factor sigma-54 [Myxococcota bacterium]MDW8363332.1 RNA polymerase factor sigma-54 [Myxococcales bacterium]
MEIKQQLRLSQQLVMTPQLQQAIKLLQMSRMELIESVRQELLENPLLEEVSELSPEMRGPNADSAATVGDVDNAPLEEPALERQIAADDRRVIEESVSGKDVERRAGEIDWERYLENHALQAPLPVARAPGDGEDLPGLESTLSRGERLDEHLLWQMRMGEFREDELRFGALVVGNLDDDGYLRLDDVPPEEVVPRLAAEAGIDPEDAEEVLREMQRLDPVGTCARTLQECLRVQAEHYGMDELVLRVIDRHLPNLEKKNFAAIARDLEVSLEEVHDVAQVVADLDPRPGRNYTGPEPQYIVPDVFVHKVGDRYYVVPNDDGMPRLKISGFYRAAMVGDPKAREYIQTKLRSAQWLIRSIDQRRKTIVRVTECIVEKQRDFFDHGVEYLKPMILRDVAEAVGMHESTISRVTSNKYVHTPRGLFELKYFFNSAIRRDNDDDIASEAVKQAIKGIIAQENPAEPLSDRAIVEILGGRGIRIARRTVAKYREMLGILSSGRRRRVV